MEDFKKMLVRKMWINLFITALFLAVCLAMKWYIPILIVGGIGTLSMLMSDARPRQVMLGKMFPVSDWGAAIALATGLSVAGIAGAAWAWAVFSLAIVPINTVLVSRYIEKHTDRELMQLFGIDAP